MRLFPPIKDFKPQLYPMGDVTQFFGSNKELYSKAVCTASGCLQGHNGWDIVRPFGEPIYSATTGKVVEVKEEATGFGRHVRVISNDLECVYGHLSEIAVSLGQSVNAGDLIGKMGNTGFVVSGSTPYWGSNPYAGTHLHFGIRGYQPYQGVGQWNISWPTGDRGTILAYGNGFFGAIPMSASDFGVEPVHYFSIDCKKGDQNEEVAFLQAFLVKQGLMSPVVQAERGYYGPKTANGVLAFQLREGVELTWYERYIVKGSKFGPKTRSKANSVLGG